jgi:hypothetical protein
MASGIIIEDKDSTLVNDMHPVVVPWFCVGVDGDAVLLGVICCAVYSCL